MVKVPSSLVSAVRTSPVLTLVTLTWALATRASLGSLTVPTIAPLLFWEKAEPAKREVNRASRNSWATAENDFLIFDSSSTESGLKRCAGTDRAERKTEACCRKPSLLSQRTKFLV